MNAQDILYELFLRQEISLEEYLKFQELPFMYDKTKVGKSTNIGLNTGI